MIRTRIPLTVVARNEERAIGPCLDSLRAARRRAEAVLPVDIEPLVVLDDCRDRTADVAAGRGVRCVRSSGGKVEAQRRGSRPGPFQIFSDADLLVTEETLLALCAFMLAEPTVEVAFPRKLPLPPRRTSPLAHALHVYNARHGFSSQRTWFSGKCFAIRTWQMPTADEIRERGRLLPASRFHAYAEPLRVDDVYLSRLARGRGGPAAIREVAAGLVYFRAPETWRGMYRYYRRMRRELDRMDRLYPELRPPRSAAARRPDLLPHAPLRERADWCVFQAALFLCRIVYVAERAWVDRLGGQPADPWPAIEETKALDAQGLAP